MDKLTHADEQGKARMVDVSQKSIQFRKAIAHGEILLQPHTIQLIQQNQIQKGDVLAVAKIAGIQAAKKTGELIPLAHPLPITFADVTFQIVDDRIIAQATVHTTAQTGVEMEALTAVSMSLLTVYDMCKAVDKSMIITNIHLVEKIKQ